MTEPEVDLVEADEADDFDLVSMEFRFRLTAPFDHECDDAPGDRFLQLLDADILINDGATKVGEVVLYWFRTDEIIEHGDIFDVGDSLDDDSLSIVEELFDHQTSGFKEKIRSDYYGCPMNTDVVLVQHVYVAPEYRGRGVGTKVMETIKNYFGLQCGFIALQPVPYEKETGFRHDDKCGESRLIKFYERLGFRRTEGRHMLFCPELIKQPPIHSSRRRH